MKKTVEITDEELKILEQIREQNARDEAKAKSEAEKVALAASLEVKFREAMDVGHKEIKQHLKAAKEQLDLAIKASEKYGVPFSSSIVEMRSRDYVPESFSKKWGSCRTNDILDEFDMYLNDSHPGWEYWNTSSLTC